MVTAKTLPADTSNAYIYSSFIVDQAFDYPFLLLALFAIAALHLSRLQPERRTEFLLEAERYHGQALARFRAEIYEVTEANYKAVFSFSTVLFPYSCAMPVDASLNIEHAFDSILSNVLLTRRVGPLVRDFYQAMADSELGRLRPRDIDIKWCNVEPPLTTELVSLRAFVEVIRRLYPEDIAEAYSQAITTLEIIFDKAAQSPDPPSDALIKLWIHFVTPQYVELLAQKQPAALIIIAHYAVLLSRAPQYWFLEGVASQILDVANALVPATWSAWLDWPKTKIVPRTPMAMHDLCSSLT
ncbi:hypothetical protein DDE82_005104 [Stemphylium lycopersici]|uniref:Uncharacterized protein n=1 Tax=Stemphylium lycopersici TaxID=183478 RepID=A0A364MS95_STELY|nr:hypothetical protein TW65_04384 [Stemphylium lycopersici]RAR01673.1 hypothetical protein DDE83_008827 [Stemphylium lycopersici]RAR03440.1 hypothetical protein DDE82_005104 [Stemphylium lycopersici]